MRRHFRAVSKRPDHDGPVVSRVHGGVVYERWEKGTVVAQHPVNLENVESECDKMVKHDLDMLATFMSHGSAYVELPELAARISQLYLDRYGRVDAVFVAPPAA